MVQEALEAINSYMLMNIYEEDRKKWFDIWMSEERKNNAYVDNIGAVASGEWVIVLVLRSYFSIHIHISNLILLLHQCEIIKTTKCS